MVVCKSSANRRAHRDFIMDKKLLAYYCIVALVTIGLAALLSLDSNPEDFNYKFGMIKPHWL